MTTRLSGVLNRVPPRSRTLLLTILGVLTVAAAGLWDSQLQAEDELKQLIHEQHLLAVALAPRLLVNALEADTAARPASKLLASTTSVLEGEGNVVTLLHTAGRPGFVLSDGRVFADDDLTAAFLHGAPGVVLSRDAAALLGLEHRVAVAGIASVGTPGSRDRAAVVVAGSASRERDRARRDEWRTVLITLLVSALILGFGGLALRRQRRELELEQKVAVHRTERERDVELARADRMAAMAALSSGIAHEISTPLGVISGRLEQLRREDAPGERERLLTSAAHQVERIGKVIRSFLALARGDTPVLSRISAQQLAREAAQLVRHRFATAGVALQVSFDGGEEHSVACEPSLFEQVIVNLLVNALEASERGQTVELRVSVKDERVSFVVQDDGHGIPASAVAHVTEPFFTTKARKGGSGLGLAIAKEIVAHHGGELRLERRSALFTEPVALGTRATVVLGESRA